MQETKRRVVVALLLLASCTQADVVTGVVVDGDTPVEGAVVRIQTTATTVVTGIDGQFILEGIESPVRLSAWADGYFIAGGSKQSPGADVRFELVEIPDTDHSEYEWLSAVDGSGAGEGQPCVVCHSRSGSDVAHTLPVDQWREDAHSQSAVNPRFLSMYSGSDLDGNQSPPTRYITNRDYGRVPLRPDVALPYFGPGYRLDFPDSAGNCADCHLPAVAVDDPYGVDPRTVEGVGREGVTCDVCHKVWDVILDPSSGRPDPGRPGVLSFEFRRPPPGHQFFAGPYDDVAPGEDTFSPIQQEGAFCAPCHHGVFWDVVVYDSFGEWLASPYADPDTGRTCQDCHMPATGADVFALPAQGGLSREPSTIPGHLMPGAADEELLRNAVTMSVAAVTEDGELSIDVMILNDQTGHHVPTDSPLRHLILLVEAADGSGTALDLIAGPRVPEWGGMGDPAAGYYGGLPGTAYAKVLEELWTEVSPTGAYWNPTRVLFDNRIPAFGSDTTTYRFAAPPTGNVRIRVTLLFRRAYIELMDQKSWDIPDILMERHEETLER